MSTTAREVIPGLVATVVGLILILEYFAPPIKILYDLKGLFTSWSVIIGAFCILLGAIYLVRYHILQVNRHRFKEEGPYSFILLLTFFSFISVGLLFGGTKSVEYNLIFMKVLKPIAQITRGICLFYCISAAYRAFRVRSLEATALFVTGTIYALRMIPIMPVIWSPIVPVGDWILNFPNVAATRGAIIANALGAIVIGLRTLYGKEISIKGISEKR